MRFSVLAQWVRSAFRNRPPLPARSPRCRLELYQLEDRITPSTNISITSGLVVDTIGNPLSNVSTGESVDIEANWSTQNLAANASYRVSYTVNGLTLYSTYLNSGDGLTSGSGIMWGGTFQAAPGINYVSVTVDPDHSVAETTYSDNTFTFTFTASAPAVGNVYPTVAQMRNAYGVNSIPAFNGATADGTGQTIAIVDCYNDPTIVTDLDGFDLAMSLNTTSSQTLYQAYGAAASFLTVYNEYGTNITGDVSESGSGVAPDEVPGPGSQEEITMAVEWAHAMAPGAKIDLIETDNSTSLLMGDQVAEELPGVTVVSNNWSEPEWAGETADDSVFTTPTGHVGITWLAGSGNDGTVATGTTSGSAGYYPSVSPNVVSVGGSQLTIDNGGYGSETGWSFPAPAETITNGGNGYSQTGIWGSVSGGFSGFYSTAPGGTAATATWTMPITSAEEGSQGETEVSATWTASPNNATNATYTIYDGLPSQGNILGTVTVNQTLPPVGTADGGSQFQELGVYSPFSGQISVVLNAASANGTIVADAVGAAVAEAGTGGISQYESEPSYQLGVQNTGQRTTPDLAMNASNNSGVICFENGTLSYDNYGTSLASACFAGLIAIANQGRVAAGGTEFNSPSNPQQILQAIYSLPASDFNSVTTGYNGYSSTSGYDYNTGLGTPIANLLVPDLVGYGLTPAVTGLTPTAGPVSGGNNVTITGTNLLSATAVDFGSVPAASFTVVSSTEIVAAPQAASGSTVDVTVTTSGGTTATSSADQYTLTSGPAIASLSPAAGLLVGGIPITISGTDLSAVTAVDFGSTSAQISSESYSQVVVTEPSAAAGVVTLEVITPGGTATTTFTYVNAPSISSISPPSGPVAGGTSVNIFGTNLDGATVTFGGVPASIIGNIGSQIIVYDPAGTAGSQTLAVITPGGTSVTTFTYVAEPSPTGLSPAYGPVAGDTRVTITGTALLGATQVAFGGLTGTLVSNSTTQIVVTSPAETAGTVPVTVTTQGGTAVAGEFTFVPPADPATSTVSVSSSSLESGTGITVTLQTMDANGDDITTGGLTVSFALANTTGGGQGNFGTVTDNGNGTYTATFTGSLEGSNNVTAAIDGQSVTSGSPQVTVTPGSVSLQTSVVSVLNGTVASGSTDTITFTAEDANSNDLITGGLTVHFSLGAGAGTGTGTFGPVTDNGNGTYTATFTGELAGTTTITATVNDQPVTSPASLTVTPGPIDPAASVATLSAETDPAGSAVTITLQTLDATGNDLTTGGAAVKFTLGDGTATGTFSSVTDNGDGTYTATFIGETAGINTIDVTVDDETVGAKPAISVTPGPVDPALCTISIATGTVTSGSTDTVTLQAIDAYGNDLTTGGATVKFVLGDGTATGTFSSATDNGNGTYTATFTGQLAGASSITATVSGDPVSTTPQVTVDPGPLDPANSAVSLSSSSVASGDTIQVTVQARDAAGNDLTAGGASVKLGLGTGSGDGNFGSVTDNGNGTYTAMFTGTLPGSNGVTATVDGTTVTTLLPTVTITPGSVSPTKSTITLNASSVAAGSGVTVTLQAKDQYGNDLTTGGFPVKFVLASGPGSGAFGSVTDNGNGTFTATFTGTTAGAASITAWIDNDESDTPSAQTITVTAGPVDLAMCSAQLSSSSVASGATANVTVSLADANGNPITSGTAVSAALESLTGGYGTFGTVVNNGDGTYSIPFSATTAGSNSIVVTVGGSEQQLPLLPIQVTPGAIDPSHSIITLSTSEIQLGGEATATLQTRDAAGNDLTTGGQIVIFQVSGGGSASQVTDNGNGTYTATVTGTADGNLTISATVGGQAVTSPTLAVSGNEVDPAKSKLTLGETTVVAGQETTVTFQAEDNGGQAETAGGLVVMFKLGSRKGGQGQLTTATYSGDGTYTATFTGTIAGSNTITASVEDVSGAPKAASIKVTAGTLSWSSSELTVSSETVKAGKEVTVTLQPTDAYGNKIVEKSLPVAFAVDSGTGQGTFSTVKYHSNGTYTATFTGTTEGTANLAATIDDTLVTSPAPVVTVIPGAASTKMSSITLSSPSVAVGGAISITLQAVDAHGNDLTTGVLVVSFKLGKGTAKGKFGKVTNNKNGTYTVTFTATSAGESPITATIGGVKVTATSEITVTAV